MGFLATLAKPPIAAAIIIVNIPMPPRAGNPHNGPAAVAAKGFAGQQVFYFRLILAALPLVLLYAPVLCPTFPGQSGPDSRFLSQYHSNAERLYIFGPMSIHWTQKVESLC